MCTKLPLKWKAECTSFVSNQLESIIDMLIAEVQPKEICVLLEACQPKSISENVGGDIGKLNKSNFNCLSNVFV